MYVQAAASLSYIRQITRVTCQLVDSPFICYPYAWVSEYKCHNTIANLIKPPRDHHSKWGIYQLTCNTCNLSYVGQTSRSLNIHFQEHIRYIRYNNPQSAYALHILQNQHEYGQMNSTMTLLKHINNLNLLLPYEQYYIQFLHDEGKLIPELSPGEINSLFRTVINP